ncbi:MAG: prolyl-tRNA synthetase [Candidatus Taylorbacteria bacterium RIFCSPHIGHO2_02_FULL_47_18]|uniref:Proline--tRNA ligase n=1 Tax=Candidatus Taylorbacteria bacterium RIFCSPLOWO2_01_FULL_48_100 TaxID=1802322 RepID=A0A1G2NEL4_9BACT|nr:MAG: prolyl-tRNA synthetase [Candidatus Taylorbacteria bacterium RIFCSPHIGHO2_01_FULL_48_38]OHA28270.1 MAG: prolyl-tRNA synthetase [Candidatus Taylorbacteria bacterium RIFCSPHIGHO2_02_FULL_47_18]OHA33782.1 MAG: prolyl-tRNA synthetase [Candidatus Taylorbacteria bacterium RIFCSPLOWO2_01_FULL_48_100]OHA40598.1 MAG: prolyl-tRNA synthetase [Candidatus Taylorbacteria bacterium RIFCSPLOWO2_02_FULL_48_16]OHA44759.1 MAG: prolyl-tRNA synthetase [Candidatus Taylorbacteria bacterium RIFCSPLOWO2_12_FULL_
MKQSFLFTKTRRDAPTDEVSRNAKLLIRGGFIHKEMAGVYSYLPLGLRVLNKVVGIIREEMNALGGQEVYLSALQDREVWEKTGRWDERAVDSWFKTELKNGAEAGLAFTHEEPITAMMRGHISSYKDLPKYPYQFQVKFRNETRARSGLIRGREFLMKDLYSFSRNETEHQAFYEKIKQAYHTIFARIGLGEKTVLTFASGGSFSKYSHEFQTLCAAGEDTIHLCDKCRIAVNSEIISEHTACPQCGNEKLTQEKAVEVGNIFTLGTKFSDALNLKYRNEVGKETSVFMGSYGIGPGRAMGVAVELFADEKGIVWPKSIAPFAVHLISLASSTKVKKEADALYEKLQKEDIEVLYDDRDARAGEKFADADLIGIPLRAVVSDKTPVGKVEIKARLTVVGQERTSDSARIISHAELLKMVSGK